MDIGVISVRYARALIKAALGMKLEDQVYQEMQTLYKSYIDVPELRFTIDNPMLSKDKKQALLTTALGKNPSELSKKFISDKFGSYTFKGYDKSTAGRGFF